MTCRKGKYCITCEDSLRGIQIEERQGYIIDEKLGFTRDEQGFYIPTELETGAMINAPGGLKYSLVQAYQSAKSCLDKYPQVLEAYKKKYKWQKSMEMIKKYREQNNDAQKDLLSCSWGSTDSAATRRGRWRN